VPPKLPFTSRASRPRQHFKEAYDVKIDESCKDLSRLCLVAHDPDAYIRSADAWLIEPLPPGGNEELEPLEEPGALRGEARRPADKPVVTPDGLMMLPKQEFVTYTKSAASIFKRISERVPPAMFVRSGSCVMIQETISSRGATLLSIEETTPQAFRSAVKSYGTVFIWGKAEGGAPVIGPDALALG